MKDPLFQPIKINKMEVSNRIYLPAMHLAMAENYQVTDRLVSFYAERARGGAGIIIVGYATIDELSGNTTNIGAHDDSFLPGLSKLASAIKENGARAGVQLNHSGRYNHSFFTGGKQPVAPSPIASRLTKETPRELTIDEIKKIIERFADAAQRVQKAGFDAVEVLSGTGYLISEFLSPLTNKRTDEYGGPFENRIRFGLEVMQAIRERVGADFPLIVRMNGNDFMPGGQDPAELRRYARELTEKAGVDAICVNVGWHEARVPQITTSVPRGAFAYLARKIKENVHVPVIASHRINDPQTARELIADGMCDMVAMGRALIADPFLPKKTEQGREDAIVHCVACAQGCFDNLFKLKHVECLCNPRAGHEIDLREIPAPAPKNVAIIGGGAAGMCAAIAAADRGHRVTIYERSDRLGGQLHLAGAPPGRREFAILAADLEKQVRVRDAIKVRLKCEAGPSEIKKHNPDYVIVATGARPMTPPIPGIELPHVVQAWDVLEKKVYTGRKVVIVGGGAVGVETALFIAERGTISAEVLKFLLINKAEDPDTLYELCTCGTKQVTLIEMLETIGKDFGKTTRWTMIQDIERSGVQVMTATRAKQITSHGIIVEKDETEIEIQADTVVIAAGAKPENSITQWLKNEGIPHTVIGDAQKIGMAFDAIHQGYAAGRAI